MYARHQQDRSFRDVSLPSNANRLSTSTFKVDPADGRTSSLPYPYSRVSLPGRSTDLKHYSKQAMLENELLLDTDKLKRNRSNINKSVLQRNRNAAKSTEEQLYFAIIKTQMKREK